VGAYRRIGIVDSTNSERVRLQFAVESLVMDHDFPHLTKGKIGSVDWTDMNAVFTSIDSMKREIESLKSQIRNKFVPALASFPAEITGYREREGNGCNRFEYSWKQVIWNTTDCKFTTHQYMHEVNGDPTLKDALTSTIADDPFALAALNGSDNFAPSKPVEGNPIVPMFHWKGLDGQTIFWFYAPELSRVRVRITGAQLIGPNRYRYQGESVEQWNVAEVRWIPDASPVPYMVIYNLAEEENTATRVHGYILQANQEMMRIQDGEKMEVVGIGQVEGINPVFQFNWPNDVKCDGSVGVP
jgi:hypothetical protein